MSSRKIKNRNSTGLGRAIINQKARDIRTMNHSDLYSVDMDSSSRMKSITQENDLDEFLNTAQLAGTDFTAEKQNMTVLKNPDMTISNDSHISQQEEHKILLRQKENRSRLRVPRRPRWTKDMSAKQLDSQEREAFLKWRRGIARLQDEEQFLLTPFERNLEVWRQLWRVIERSQLIVQIVDARNPLRFRCEDLENYVKDFHTINPREDNNNTQKDNLLLINKADLLTYEQRQAWADYFAKQAVQFAFFSAANASTSKSIPDDSTSDVSSHQHENPSVSESADTEWTAIPDRHANGGFYLPIQHANEHEGDPRARVLNVDELIALIQEKLVQQTTAARAKESGSQQPTSVIGLVGYPNVGKSSTINAIFGEKRVAVSSTPGKTRHFQTLQLSPEIIICDCPGLVFPQFATTAAELVCDGILPIDQMRDYIAPVSLVAKRIPKDIVELTYSLEIPTDGNGLPTAEDILKSYASARGYMRSGQGSPDEARAARYILKDYVNARLLFCHPPPDIPAEIYNLSSRELELRKVLGRKQTAASAAREMKKVAELDLDGHSFITSRGDVVMDDEFFASPTLSQGYVVMDTTQTLKSSSVNGGPHPASKKHFKGNKKAKRYPVGS